MDKIETMRAFAAVAKEGSFTAAARRLGVSTRLVSKYVAQLDPACRCSFSIARLAVLR